MDQLSLVFFTVLAQVAVGIFISLGLFDLLAKPDTKALNKSYIAVWGILAIAALASMTHLGQPLRMFNVLAGVGHSSPLSLEIVALTLFGGAGVAFTAMRLFNVARALQKPVLVLAMILGVVLIKAIASVYTLATVPTWNSGWTAFQFMMTAAVAGPLGAATLLRLESGALGNIQAAGDKALATTGCILLTTTVAGYVGYLFWLGQLPLSTNLFMGADYHLNLLVARVALLVAGLLIWVASAMRGFNRNMTVAGCSLVMVVSAELLGRIFFYDVMISAGSGM